MPPDRYSSRDTFDITLLGPQATDAPDGLDNAVRAIETVCRRGDPEIAGIIEELDSRPYILEYIISGALRVPTPLRVASTDICLLVLDDGAYEKLSKWIIAEFPASKTPNVMDAMSMRLLQRFSSSLLSAEYPSPADASPHLREFCRKVELSFNALKALEESGDGASTGGNVSPVSRKKGKATANNRRINPAPFNSMGIVVPATDAEVRDAYVGTLSQLQNILEVCGFAVDRLCT